MAKESTGKSLRQTIYEKIRDDITYRRLVPGERLTEMELSERYSASRSPIREALRQLESEGLLSFQRNKGITVRKLTKKQLEELYESMAVLEGYVAGLAVKKMDEKAIETLSTLHKELIRAARERDLPLWFHNNTRFHRVFRDTAENETLNDLIDMIQRRVHLYQHRSVDYNRAFDLYIEHHHEIITLCKQNDSAGTERVMRIHVQTAYRYIMESLLMDEGLLVQRAASLVS